MGRLESPGALLGAGPIFDMKPFDARLWTGVTISSAVAAKTSKRKRKRANGFPKPKPKPKHKPKA